MKTNKLYFLLFILIINCNAFAGKRDSLTAILRTSQYDTTKAKVANNLAAIYEFMNADSCKFFAEKAYQLADKSGDKKQKMIALYNLGLAEYLFFSYQKCIDNCNASMVIVKQINDTIYQGNILYKLSRAYSKMARYDLTIQTQLDAIRFFEKHNNTRAVAVMYNNMSIAYKYLGDHKDAIKALRKALKKYIETKDTSSYMTPYLNIADNYLEMKSYDTSLLYIDSAILMVNKYNKKSNDIAYIAYWKGEIYFHKKEYKKALSFFEISHESRLKCNDIDDQIYTFLGIGKTLMKLGKTNDAIPYLKQALENSKTSNAKKREMMSYQSLAEGYFKLGDYENSAKSLMRQLELRDSIFNDEKSMAIMSARTKFHVENLDKEIEMLNVKNEIAQKNELLKDAELHKTKSRQLMLYSFLAFTVISIGGLFYIIRRRNKTNILLNLQKDEIGMQKEILEQKNNEIMDSIQYAKRIQSAILPPSKVIKACLEQSFILYKPKDIVAGDFYWLEQKDNIVFFAAADCTGHGVPGAMLSVVCNNALNRSVREHGLTEPGEILDKTRDIVIGEFEKSDEDVKDGMDIALCSLDGNKLKYAGANNPLWIIRNNEIIETKANKQPIGVYDNPEIYVTHETILAKGDTIYIFSDGYADQFGGEKGKKFKPNTLRELLLSIQDKTMEQQRLLIDAAFEEWKGELEQIDDVCVIGVRV